MVSFIGRLKRRGTSRRVALVLCGLVVVVVVWLYKGGQEGTQEEGAQEDTKGQGHNPGFLVGKHTAVDPSNSALTLEYVEPQPRQKHGEAGGAVLPSTEGGELGALPGDVLVRLPPPGMSVVKVVEPPRDREAALMERMEKSMLRAAGAEEVERARLPRPREILREEVGPVGRVDSLRAGARPRAKLLVVARQNSGFPVLGQFLTKQQGFFCHGEPPQEGDSVGDLLNCVLSPEMVATFPQQVAGGDFGRTAYFQSECLLDSRAVCGDPLSYETTCSERPYQLLRTRHSSLVRVKQLLEDNQDLRVVFLVRDPRGVLAHTGSTQRPQAVCSSLVSDLSQARALLDSHPGHFVIAHYEVLATRPVEEVTSLLSHLGIQLSLQELEGEEGGWSTRENTVQKVNSWKARLGSQQLQKIENQCLEVLSQLEYPLLGQGVAGSKDELLLG